MKAKLLLRIAAALMLLHTIGHTVGTMSWRNAPNSSVQLVIDGMENNHFDFMGRTVSLADFYSGYGFIMIAVLLLLSVTLWLLANDANSPLSGKLQMAIAMFLLILAVTEFIYFFAFAAVLSMLAGLATAFSRIPIKKKVPRIM